jgi:hypothetical protein
MAAVSDPVVHFCLIAGFLVLVMFVLTRYRNEDVSVEEFRDTLQQNQLHNVRFEKNVPNNSQFSASPADRSSAYAQRQQNTLVPLAAEEGQADTPKAIQSNTTTGVDDGDGIPTDCFPKDQLNPHELLPGDANSTWAQVNPAGQGDLGSQNFLNAGHHIGVNTVGQTLRNSNMGLRSEPPNPQMKVSPWNQTTIEPDSNRRGLEIGGDE